MLLLVEPEVFLLPVQLPEALQVSTPTVLQLSVVEPLYATCDGLAEMFKVGVVGVAATDTLAESLAEPPGPLQVKV